MYKFELFLTVIQALMREEVQGSNLEEPSLHVYMSLTGNSVIKCDPYYSIHQSWSTFSERTKTLHRKQRAAFTLNVLNKLREKNQP